MTTIKTKLNSSEVLEKEFKVRPNGYDATEVDQYLDLVIEDYKLFEDLLNQFKMLQKTNSVLRNKVDDLQLEIETLKTKLKSKNNESNNFDLNNLEKIKQKAAEETKNYKAKQTKKVEED